MFLCENSTEFFSLEPFKCTHVHNGTSSGVRVCVPENCSWSILSLSHTFELNRNLRHRSDTIHTRLYAMLQYLMLQATHKMEMHDNGIINMFFCCSFQSAALFSARLFSSPLSVCLCVLLLSSLNAFPRFFATTKNEIMKCNEEESKTEREKKHTQNINYPL